MRNRIIVDVWHKINVIVLLISNLDSVIKYAWHFVLFIIFIALNWISKLWIETQISRRLANRRWAIMKKKNSSWELYTRKFRYRSDESAKYVDEYVLTLLSCFYSWLFIASYFWFLRALYYDSRPIPGQSCSRSYIFIAAAISRDTRTRVSGIFFSFRREGASFEFFTNISSFDEYFELL